MDGEIRHRIVQRSVALSEEIDDHSATAKMVELAMQQMSKIERPGGFFVQPRIAPEESAYAGGQVCIACHRSQHVQWAGTTHAHAYQTLIAKHREGDMDCYSCHVTGHDEDGGPSDPTNTMGLHDVQCEACHGPSKAHTLGPVEIPPGRMVNPQTCTKCHDGGRDGGQFDVDVYWPKVVHAKPG